MRLERAALNKVHCSLKKYHRPGSAIAKRGNVSRAALLKSRTRASRQTGRARKKECQTLLRERRCAGRRISLFRGTRGGPVRNNRLRAEFARWASGGLRHRYRGVSCVLAPTPRARTSQRFRGKVDRGRRR